jgi:hypothetical protein
LDSAIHTSHPMIRSRAACVNPRPREFFNHGSSGFHGWPPREAAFPSFVAFCSNRISIQNHPGASSTQILRPRVPASPLELKNLLSTFLMR